MNTQRLHQALRRTLVPTWCLAACLAWGEPPVSAPVAERNLLHVLVSASEDEKLRAIDSLVNRQSTSIEVRSALRRSSVQDSSPEVRGAARFALVKLQAIAPPTQAAAQPVVADAVVDDAQRLRQWKQRESIEEVTESTAEIAQAGGVPPRTTERGIQHAIPQPSDVTAVESAAPTIVRITTITSPKQKPKEPEVIEAPPVAPADPSRVPTLRKKWEASLTSVEPAAPSTSNVPVAEIASVQTQPQSPSEPTWHSTMKPTPTEMREGVPNQPIAMAPPAIIAVSAAPGTEPSTTPVPEVTPVPAPVPVAIAEPAAPPAVPVDATPVVPVPSVTAVESVPAQVTESTPAPVIESTPVPVVVPVPVATSAPTPEPVAEPTPIAAPPAVAMPGPVAPPVAETKTQAEPVGGMLPPAVVDNMPAVGTGTKPSPLTPPPAANTDLSPTQASAASSPMSLPKAEAASTTSAVPAESSATVAAPMGKRIPRTEPRTEASSTPASMAEFPPVRSPSALAAVMAQDEPKSPAKPEPAKPPANSTTAMGQPAWGVPAQATATTPDALQKAAVPAATIEKSPLMPLDSIPRDEDGRKKLAKEMLDKARTHVQAGEIAEAEAILYQIRELAIRYGRFQYSPESLEKDILKARQRLRAQAAAAAEKTS